MEDDLTPEEIYTSHLLKTIRKYLDENGFDDTEENIAKIFDKLSVKFVDIGGEDAERVIESINAGYDVNDLLTSMVNRSDAEKTETKDVNGIEVEFYKINDKTDDSIEPMTVEELEKKFNLD